MDDRSGDGTGSFEVKIPVRTNTAKFTNMIIVNERVMDSESGDE